MYTQKETLSVSLSKKNFFCVFSSFLHTAAPTAWNVCIANYSLATCTNSETLTRQRAATTTTKTTTTTTNDSTNSHLNQPIHIRRRKRNEKSCRILYLYIMLPLQCVIESAVRSLSKRLNRHGRLSVSQSHCEFGFISAVLMINCYSYAWKLEFST